MVRANRVYSLGVAFVACLTLAAAFAQAGAVADVSPAELGGYHLLYDLPIPKTFNFNVLSGPAGVTYTVDNTSQYPVGSYNRVAYYCELQSTTSGSQRQWVWVSMDTFDKRATMVGVPNANTGIVQTGTVVNNLHVESNNANITPGNFPTGNIEFWASNYNANGGGALGSADNRYDWKDSGGTTSGGHGSMQVHNYALQQTLFGFNGLNQSGHMGIGNQNPVGTGDTDWTFNGNASSYSIRNLQVWVGGPADPAAPAAPANVAGNVPDLAGYKLVYQKALTDTAALNVNGPAYDQNYSTGQNVLPGSFSKVAYYLELQKPGDPNPTYVAVTADAAAISSNVAKIGIPTTSSGMLAQHKLSNMSVYSNSGSVTTGANIGTGNIEFWPSDYNASNAVAIPGASGSTYDYGDGNASRSAGYGSMQIHNYGAGQTVFAYNHWGNSGSTNSDLTIGNMSSGNPDATFAANTPGYSVKNLYVLVGGPALAAPAAPANLVTNAPELAGYKLVYQKSINNSEALNNIGANYDLDYSAAANVGAGSFSRVAYYLELHKTGDPAGATQWVEVSADAFSISTDPAKIGIPNTDSGAAFQKVISRMNVSSNVVGNVTNCATGNIEFWPSNYGGQNDRNIPGAATTFDFGDGGAGTSSGYGSMQIHNYGAGQTLFAYNRWGSAGGNADLGIGNAGSGNPDWTFAQNANGYDVKNLYVLVGGPALPDPIKIMPVGDSITYGSSVVGGYRAPLESMLNATGMYTTFVGANTGNSYGMTSPAHDGYGGYRVDQIRDLPILNRLALYQPDVVLMMIGTNDVSQGTANSAQTLDDLVNMILTSPQSPWLFLAQITPRNDAKNPETIAYNEQVAQIVAKYQGLGYYIKLVDMFDALDSSDLADSVHPNAGGYYKMAETWMAALDEALLPEPATLGLIALAFGGLGGYVRRRRAA
ncbi:MAG: hypothetical protein BWX88_03900 [Planctomycetes bacterium ADurb.Bin126]|nr:MAG: hypothetical protein BWX88_03900 [Planctomycetes bacterium ADurb.Bin126]HOD81452.1 GDSL-type esterase/lipase family protein [Phycisphaerae bacterium]HQL75858.1 GDSL-type esterase/lipase family protein [Phycisphaerae bacterium]